MIVQSTKYVYMKIEEYGPLVGIVTLPTLFSPVSVQCTVRTSPAGEGLGESQFRRLEIKLSTLPTLWYKACEKIVEPGDDRGNFFDSLMY